MRFVHSLVMLGSGKKVGWHAPVELGEDTPQSISFVLPVDGPPDDRYACEAVKVTRGGREIVPLELVRQGDDSFYLPMIGGTPLWFTALPVSKAERLLPYLGRIKHPDFRSRFLEIEPEDHAALDRLYNTHQLVVVGCDPETHYPKPTAPRAKRSRARR